MVSRVLSESIMLQTWRARPDPAFESFGGAEVAAAAFWEGASQDGQEPSWDTLVLGSSALSGFLRGAKSRAGE